LDDNIEKNKFIEKVLWALGMEEVWGFYSSQALNLNLNPLDFSIWSVLQEKVRAMPHTSLAALRRSITRQWNPISWAYICRTCHSFCRRLLAVVAKKCSYIK
jgi:hypothetical protein